MFAARIILPHLSVSLAMNLPNSAGVIDIGTAPRSKRACWPPPVSAAALTASSSGLPIPAGAAGKILCKKCLILLGFDVEVSCHHQPEAQHPKSSAIHKNAGRLPHLMTRNRMDLIIRGESSSISGGRPARVIACRVRNGPPPPARTVRASGRGRAIYVVPAIAVRRHARARNRRSQPRASRATLRPLRSG